MYISISTLCPRNLSPKFLRLARISGPRFRPPAADPKWAPQKWSRQGSIFWSFKSGSHICSAPSTRNWTTLGGQIRCPNFGSAWSVDLAARIRYPESRKGLPSTSRRAHDFSKNGAKNRQNWCKKNQKWTKKNSELIWAKFEKC